jgi:hypothetical protein
MKTLNISYLLLSFLVINTIKAQVNVSSGLVAYWTFDSTLNDQSGNNFNGLTSTTPLFTNSQSPNYNKAIQFNSAHSLVFFGDILDSVFTKTQSVFTVSCWANTSQLPPYAGGNMIFTKSFGGNGPYQWAINHDTDGYVYGSICFTPSANDFVQFKSASAVQLNTWFHVVMQFNGIASDSAKVKLKINGQDGVLHRVVGTISDKTWDTDMPVCVGGSIHPIDSTTGNHYNGLIDEARIYNRILTNAEIDTLANIINTSVKQISHRLNINIEVFPNPAEGNLNILNSYEGVSTYRVYSIEGRLLKEFQSTNKLTVIDIESMQAKGMLFIEILPSSLNIPIIQKVVLR